MKRRAFLVAVALIGTQLCATACGPRDEEARPYRIGALYPMSGVAARYGQDSKVAAQMAADEINAAGGINGRSIELLFRDSEAKADRASELAKELILKDNVDFLMGVVSSSAALAVTEVSRQQKIIFVGTDHASSKLTYKKFQPYYFRVSNNTYQSMAAQAIYSATQDWERFFVVGPDYEYGHALWTDFQALCKREGVSIDLAGEAWPKLFETDYASTIASIKRAKPDVIVAGFWGADMIAFLKQARAARLLESIDLISCDAGGNYGVFEALTDDMPAGVVLSARHHNNWPATEANASFVSGFHKLASTLR